MAEDTLRTYASDLFSVIEVNAAGVVPVSSCVETLCSLNTDLTREKAEAIVKELRLSDRRNIDRNNFITAVLRALEYKSYQSARSVLRDLILRFRLTYRKKYLMMDIGANTPIPSLTENPTVVALFKELFSSASHGKPYITRSQLEELVHNILPDSPASACNLVKAALSEDESDMIGFYEFITVMQPITSRQSLSELVERFRSRREARKEQSSLPYASFHGIRPLSQSSLSVLSSLSLSASAVKSVALPLTASDPMDMELQMYRRWDAEAQRDFDQASFKGFIGITKTTPSTVASHDREVIMDKRDCEKKLSVMERELIHLRRENESLRHDLLLAQMQKPSLRVEEDGRIVELSGDEFFNRENAILREELSEMKESLRMYQAENDLHSDMTNIATLLRKGVSSAEVLRRVYPEESTLFNRYQHLVRMTEKRRDDIAPPGSAARLLITQLDLIIQGYQALYRRFRENVETDGVLSTPSYSARTSSASVSEKPIRSLRPRRAPWVD
ncbi:uncharacterized protein TM35_000064130 [Trypanosoma theileri]|uniref:EF-hand domain-containing protein n=1 Tax=Trypanosoma theileri TaxID=67003 RepID=A0A1X0P3M3_9TRYP|nr:uncharacterized protein TM35_000064130 [Trypanosoma theileri]ORC91408.1 hypothetical protein TM35_000064130 [Trypanosoma theileri]